MPIAERLRALDEPAPDVDLDRALSNVRRRAHKHRRVRAALVSGAAVVLAVAAGAGLLAQDGGDESLVDTVDGTESERGLDTLVALLLDDDAVLQVVPELVPKTDYSTGESYGRIADEELVGPTAGAVAGVVRQWSLDSGTVGAGVPRGSPSGAGEEVTDGPTAVISTVVQFPTADAATEAADAVLGLLPGQATDVGESPVRGETTDVEMNFSDGVAVTTTGPFLVAVQVGFAGEADRSVLTGLADAVAQRVFSTDTDDQIPGESASLRPATGPIGLVTEGFGLWPASPGTSATAVGERFAREVLGWADPVVDVGTADLSGAVRLEIADNHGHKIKATALPTGPDDGTGAADFRIGDIGVDLDHYLGVLQSPGNWSIEFGPPPPDAVSFRWWRAVNGREEGPFDVDLPGSDADSSTIPFDDTESVVIVYLDDDGHAVGSQAGEL